MGIVVVFELRCQASDANKVNAAGQVRRHLRQAVPAGLLPQIDAALAALLPTLPPS